MLVLMLMLVACDKSATTTSTSTATSARATSSTDSAGPTASGPHFTVAASAGRCAAGQECTMTIRLEASGGYHMNKEYPYKFVAAPAPDVEFLGKDAAGPATFSRAAGDYAESSETVSTLTVRFKPGAQARGRASKISGTYKLSVCSAQSCQIEQAKLALDVPVD
jgi:hypothetical protein